VAEAFSLMFYLERACEIQVAAQAGGTELVLPPAAIREKTAGQYESDDDPAGSLEWTAQLRLLERLDPGYRN
jgi:ribulose-5-phosphate 4-epimerase/fuculose-1-phosphate aldolase